MHVIGTAGHVDHGKTELILALTGIETDRLPEEKERGLTIDLGFAHFDSSDGQRIGVIDVPGHERFIRNMVAGACGVDCVLLVVAADEGWMQQSEDHAIVLAHLNINPLIVVVTKIDLVESEAREAVRTQAVQRCREIGACEPASILVSARDGTGIDELKSLIETELSKAEAPAAASAWLYIDRSFTVQGSGNVITGSLMGGTFAKGERIRILPEGKEARIRGIQSYYEEVEVAGPVSRVALNISGNDVTDLARGNCIVAAHSDFASATEFIIDFRNRDSRRPAGDPPFKNGAEVEIAVGTGHYLGRLFPVGKSPLIRILAGTGIPAKWLRRALLIQHGGSRILGGGEIVWLGDSSRKQRDRLASVYSEVAGHPETQLELRVECSGFALRQGDSGLFDSKLHIDAGEWTFLRRDLESWVESILAMSKDPTGTSVESIVARIDVDRDAVKTILSMLVAGGKVDERGSMYYAAGAGAEGNLSPLGRKLLAELRSSGKAGLAPTHLKYAGAGKELKNLSRLGLAVNLDGAVFLSHETYRQLAEDILIDLSVNDEFSISHARDRTGLSRKYLLPILNRMGSDGYVRRQDDVRIVTNLTPHSDA